MTITIDKLAKILQTLFTTEADTAAKESGMIQRRRKISGAGFVQTLVFGWLEDPTTTIDELGDELNVSISLLFGVRPIFALWGHLLFGVCSLGSALWGQCSLGSDSALWGQTDLVLFGVQCSLGSDRFSALWGQTDLDFSLLRPGQGRVLPVPGVSLSALWGRVLFGVECSLRVLFASALWGQTDLEFSPLRPGQGRVLPVPGVSLGSDCLFGVMSLWGQGSRVLFGVECSLGSFECSLGSDRFRIFSAQARPRASSSSARCLFGVRLSLWGHVSLGSGVMSLWGQTDLSLCVSLGSDRFCLFGVRPILSLCVSLGSDRFRIFSAQARPKARSSSARCLFGVCLFGVRPI